METDSPALNARCPKMRDCPSYLRGAKYNVFACQKMCLCLS